MITHLLAFSNNFLSKKAINKLISLNLEYNNINRGYDEEKQGFLLIALYNENEVEEVMKKMNFKFKPGILLCLDLSNKSCIIHKYNHSGDVKAIKEKLLPSLNYMYNLMTQKELGDVSFIDDRDPKDIEKLFENVIKT